MDTYVKNVCLAHHCVGKIQWNLEFSEYCSLPPLNNDTKVIDLVKEASIEILGKDKVIIDTDEAGMGAEDFAYMTLALPAAMYTVTIDEAPHGHTAGFKINGKTYFPSCMESMTNIAISYLKNKKNI